MFFLNAVGIFAVLEFEWHVLRHIEELSLRLGIAGNFYLFAVILCIFWGYLEILDFLQACWCLVAKDSMTGERSNVTKQLLENKSEFWWKTLKNSRNFRHVKFWDSWDRPKKKFLSTVPGIFTSIIDIYLQILQILQYINSQ